MHIRAALIIFVFTVFLSLPSIFNPILDRASDLDGNITQILYIKESLLNHHTFPQWNPYINQGIPVSADPLHAAFHPLVLPAFMLFAPSTAVKLLFFISLLSGGLGMYFLLQRLKVSSAIDIFSACILVTSGYIASHMVAGHFEKVLSFGILPWFIWSIYGVFKKPRSSFEILTSLLMALILFSGDLYNALYASIIVVTTGILGRSKSCIRASLRIIAYFLLLGAVKLIPLIELQDYIGKVREPFVGSQNIVSILYYFFVPFKPIFRIMGIGSFLETGFAWWEKVAFIGPLTLIGIVLFFARRNIFSKKQSQLYVAILAVLMLLSMPNASWNPYHWIITALPALQLFHVPSRVFGMLTIIFLTICALGYQRWYAQKNIYIRAAVIVLLLINMLTTMIFFFYITIFRQMDIRHSQTSTQLISDIKRRDKRIFYVAQYLQEEPLQQHRLISFEQKILNSNYGLQLKNSPAAAFTQFDFATNAPYSDIQPAYILGGETIRIPHGTQPEGMLKKDELTLYENFTADPYASLVQSGKAIEDVRILPNSISVNVDSSEPDQLVLLESFYPGWRVYEDGKRIDLISDRFLRAPVSNGIHTYTFVFTSRPFLAGLGISIISWSIAIGALFRRRNSIPS